MQRIDQCFVQSNACKLILFSIIRLILLFVSYATDSVVNAIGFTGCELCLLVRYGEEHCMCETS